MNFCGIVLAVNRFGDGVVQVFNIGLPAQAYAQSGLVTAQCLYNGVFKALLYRVPEPPEQVEQPVYSSVQQRYLQ